MLPLNEVKGQRLRVKRDLSIPVTFITNFYFPQTCAEDAENPQRSLRDRLIFISKSELRKRQKICGYSAYSKNLTCKFSASLMIIFLPQISQITQIFRRKNLLSKKIISFNHNLNIILKAILHPNSYRDSLFPLAIVRN